MAARKSRSAKPTPGRGAVARKTRETDIDVSAGARRRRRPRRDRRALLRPHARPARPPRRPLAHGEGQGRPAGRRAPHRRGRGHRHRRGAARRPSPTRPGWPATATPWCRSTRRWWRRWWTCPAARTSPGTRSCRRGKQFIGAYDVDLTQDFFQALVQPRPHHAARERALRAQPPPRRRGHLQGDGPRPARGATAREGTAIPSTKGVL